MKLWIVVAITAALGCGQVEPKDPDSGIADATSADASASDAETPDAFAAPGVSFDVVYGAEIETNIGYEGTGISINAFVAIVNTGTIPLDVRSLALLDAGHNAPIGTDVDVACGGGGANPNGEYLIMPGTAGGAIDPPLVSPLTEMMPEPITMITNWCSITLKYFSSGGWGAFGLQGTLRIQGHDAPIHLGFVENTQGSHLDWVAAARVGSN